MSPRAGYQPHEPSMEPYFSNGRWYIKEPGARRARRVPSPDWTIQDLAKALGMHSVVLGRYVNGVGYPEVQAMKKFEYLFGWPCSEQIDLIPFHGEGRQDMDLRYSMVLRQVIDDWKHNHPRTTPSAELVSMIPHRIKDPFNQRLRKERRDDA